MPVSADLRHAIAWRG